MLAPMLVGLAHIHDEGLTAVHQARGLGRRDGRADGGR